eukprot:CAMPEP_0170065946 /NCGR_PEP_ID=MMETSP0019_2-20121128/5826_1 /TAXON_ID=98059 /ORGANISM="Dinobryon sp., Strain UTEXLB2267" /LENGTH=1251 /DNA_ID=CAMNT_0010272909 /DNA_START=49 /DNA_END=3804 /DNA_ORIENTATION=+
MASSYSSPFSVSESFPSSYDMNRGRSSRIEAPYQKVSTGNGISPGNFKGGNFSPSPSPMHRFVENPRQVSNNTIQSNTSTPYAQTPNSNHGVNNSNVAVGVRIRPLSDREINEQSPVSFRIADESCSIEELNDQRQVVKLWGYDRAFGPNDDNEFIFQQMGLPLVDAAIDGYNTVLFMYGQTASGKTYTLFGEEGEPGVVDFAMQRVYHRVQSSVLAEFVIKLTYAELYNEELRDLLAPPTNSQDTPPLKIIDDPALGPLIQNITEVAFTSCADIKALLEEGERRRRFGVTNMNAHSSRSHVLVRLSIESRRLPHPSPHNKLRACWSDGERPQCVSTLNLVDLAGSERASKSGICGQSLKEGSFINKSLLTLGTVIAALSEGVGPQQHVPYRNSKLTRLLSTALGGNARTCMISCISPAAANAMESLSTLRFASRAKKIVNQVHRNELAATPVGGAMTRLAQQAAEIEQLRTRLGQEDGLQLIKQRLLLARRQLRSLRFLLRHAPRLLRALPQQKGLARALVGLLRDRAGSDPVELLARLAGPVQAQLADPQLPVLLQLLRARDLNDDGSEEAHPPPEEEDPDELALQACLRWTCADSELQERQLLGCEDLRGAAAARCRLLEARLEALQAALTQQSRAGQELRAVVAALEVDLHQREARQASSARAVEQLQRDLKAAETALEEATARNCSQEERLAEAARAQSSQELELTRRDAELEHGKASSEQLQRQLAAAHSQLLAQEADAERARVELELQLERLRSNMHEMLVRGGEQTEVVNSQHLELQREADRLRHDLALAQQARLRAEKESVFLQAELEAARDSQRSGHAELALTREQAAEAAGRLRELGLEVARLHAAHAVSEHESRRQLAAHSEERDRLAAELQAAHDMLLASSRQAAEQQRELDGRLHELRREAEAAAGEAACRQEALHRLELLLAGETARLERKLAAQVRRGEAALQESDARHLADLEALRGLEGEAAGLRERVAQLEAVLAEANECLERESEACEAAAEVPVAFPSPVPTRPREVVSNGPKRTSLPVRRPLPVAVSAWEEQASAQFQRLLGGLELLAAATKLSLLDERALRACLQRRRPAVAGEDFSGPGRRELQLEADKAHLLEALASSERSQRAAAAALRGLEESRHSQEGRLGGLCSQLQEALAARELCSQQLLDCELLSQRLQWELRELQGRAASQAEQLERQRTEAEEREDRLRQREEERHHLLHAMGLLEQQLLVLQAERDELFKRFILPKA